MFEAAQSFLSVLKEGDPPALEKLTQRLDALAHAYHSVPISEPADDDDDRGSRHSEWKAWMTRLGERFPDLGYYRDIDPLGEPPSESMEGNAIDDLADITLDLEDYLWRLDRFGADDANWHIRFTFQSHWGHHLRRLVNYLHAKQFYS